MSKLVILIGFVMFGVFATKGWIASGNVDNAMLVNSYSSTSIFWLFVAGAGIVFRLFRE